MRPSQLALDIFCGMAPYSFVVGMWLIARSLGIPTRGLRHGSVLAVCVTNIVLFIAFDLHVIPGFLRFPCFFLTGIAMVFVWDDDDDHRGRRRRRLREALKRVRSWAVFGFPLGRQPA